MISTQFLKAREERLVTQSGLDEDTVSIEICLCRQSKTALRDYLPAGSLFLIGGKQRWWGNERRLAKWLAAAGHQVLFVDVKQTKQRISGVSPQATPVNSRQFIRLPGSNRVALISSRKFSPSTLSISDSSSAGNIHVRL
jgi:hypothetical protein